MWLDREAWHGFVVRQLRFGYGQLGVALQPFAARVARVWLSQSVINTLLFSQVSRKCRSRWGDMGCVRPAAIA